MCLIPLWPEIRGGELFVQVHTKVIHDSDWKHDVHAELAVLDMLADNERRERTLKTSRLGPPMTARTTVLSDTVCCDQLVYEV